MNLYDTTLIQGLKALIMLVLAIVIQAHASRATRFERTIDSATAPFTESAA
jgi:hypothetical protein